VIRAVIDTSVLIRYLIRPSAAIKKLIEVLWLGDKVQMVTTPELIEELAGALERDYIRTLIRPAEGQALLDAIYQKAEILPSFGKVPSYTRDPNDDKFVTVPLPNDAMKGRIIGRSGRNIRAFEQASGVDVIVDDTPEAVIISSLDPVRREIARVAMSKLIVDGRIHPARIEKLVADAKKEVEAIIREERERAVYEAGVPGLHTEIVKLLGRLPFACALVGSVDYLVTMDKDILVLETAGDVRMITPYDFVALFTNDLD
jgi:ribonuclease Y